MRRALVLHLYYEDLALDLLARLDGLGAGFDVFVTGPHRGNRLVETALRGLGGEVEWIDAPDTGFDVLPFLTVLQVLDARGYDIFAKLHTKRGGSGFARPWRDTAVSAVAGSGAVIDAATRAFAANAALGAIGPAELYLSAEINMLRNAANVLRLGEIAWPVVQPRPPYPTPNPSPQGGGESGRAFGARPSLTGTRPAHAIPARPPFVPAKAGTFSQPDPIDPAAAPLPRDWGFFAGTMFWGRVAAFAPLLALLPPAVGWETEADRDGQVAHAVERLFGLAPAMAGMATATLAFDTRDRPVLAEADPRRIAVLQALAGLGHPPDAAALSPDEKALVRRANPLLHYLTAGAAEDFDPNPLFANAWYRDRNTAAGTTPLSHYRGHFRNNDPSPRFRGNRYLRDHPWLRHLGRDPLSHFLGRADWREGFAEPEPETPTDWRSGGPERNPAERLARLRADETWTIAIKIATPRQPLTEWGDVHFAAGLMAALERLGHDVRIDRREDWYDGSRPADDVVIVLRGPESYAPEPGAFAILWIISHPDQIGHDEMAAYDQVHVASAGYATLLRTFLDVPVGTLLQATDTDRFAPPEPLPEQRRGVVFAGNTRGVDRRVVRWAIEAGLRPALYGSGWDAVAPGLRPARRIDNSALPALYANAAAVLNDHWPAMRDFGIASNRLFDVVAAGGVPISDPIPGFARLLPGAAIEIAAADALPRAVAEATGRPAETRRALAAKVHAGHSFDRRAAAIVAGIRHDLPVDQPEPDVIRVHVVFAGEAPDRNAYRRLISPLTLDDAGPIALSLGPATDPVAARGADSVLLQAGIVEDPAALAALLRAIPSRRRLVVDCPDGELDLLPRDLLVRAEQIWLPAPVPGITGAGKRRIVPDSVDPRLWRDYHRPRRFAPRGPIRFALFGPTDRDQLLVTAFAALNERRPAAFELLVPSGFAEGFEAPWLHALDMTAAAFPVEAAWLRGAMLDVALCLGEGPSADVAFIEASALGLLSVTATRGPSERGLALAAGDGFRGLIEVLERIMADPLPFSAIATAAQAAVWTERSALGTARTIADLLQVTADS